MVTKKLYLFMLALIPWLGLAAHNMASTVSSASSRSEFHVVGVDTYQPQSALTLWYNQPATTSGVADRKSVV